MIKFLKKIKLKHLARLGLVLMLGCYLSLFLCSATYTCNVTCNVTFSNPDNLPYEYSGIGLNVNYFEEYTVNLGDSFTLSVSLLNTTQSLFVVRDGDLYFIDDGVLEQFSEIHVSMPDGYYNMISITGFTYSDGSGVYCPLLDGYVVSYSYVDEFVNFVYCESVPTNIDVVLVDITDGFNTSNVVIPNVYLFLIPSPPPLPPQASITDVWGGILTWVTTGINSVTGVFWNGSSLTLIGMLSLIGVSIALILLIINKVKDFLHLQ